MLDEHLQYPNALPKGYTLEHYRIVQTLAEDNVSLTYLASTPQQEIMLIVEYLPKHLALRNKTTQHVQLKGPNCKYDYEWGLTQYYQEISELIHIKHSNINAICHFVQANNTLYKISKYINGVPLKSYVQHKKLSEDDIIILLTPLLAGLNTLHQAGYLHGDINPYTLFIEHDTEQPIIMQLGTIKHLFSAPSNDLSSHAVSAPPTPYVAYEQYYDLEKQGVWTDIYALGAVLYELTTGNTPTASLTRLNVSNNRHPSFPS